LVDEVVVVLADGHEELDVGRAAVAGPFDGVVWFGLGDRDAAAGDRAVPVHGAQRASLFAAGEAAGAAVFEDDTVVVEEHGGDVGEEREPADRVDGQFDAGDPAVDPGPGMEPVEVGAGVDRDRQIDPPRTTTRAR
jgi:hypothetical protein